MLSLPSTPRTKLSGTASTGLCESHPIDGPAPASLAGAAAAMHTGPERNVPRATRDGKRACTYPAVVVWRRAKAASVVVEAAASRSTAATATRRLSCIVFLFVGKGTKIS